MDLEIADYERTVKSLHATINDREVKIQILEEELQRKEEQRTCVQKLLGIFKLLLFCQTLK